MLASFPLFTDFGDYVFVLYSPVYSCFIIMSLDVGIFDVFESGIVVLVVDAQNVFVMMLISQ